jgi:hypothetical protein
MGKAASKRSTLLVLSVAALPLTTMSLIGTADAKITGIA